jgi:hypothetical protein
MQTVFSHIIQKHFSQENENVATDALAYILNSSGSARNGMMKLIRGIVPSMPGLQFQTQQSESNIRPDMWGYDNGAPHVFIENKFWAGLTDNQPVSYIKQLAKFGTPTILLFVVPNAREQTIVRELNQRLNDAGISATNHESPAGSIVNCVSTDLGPIVAVTSWTRLLSILDLEVVDDPSARSDLLQLKALCDSADIDAFLPISAEEKTDQRTPAFIHQLNVIVQDSIQKAINQKILNIKGLLPQASWDRIGRYAKFTEGNVGIWFGTQFSLWKEFGGTPLWVIFSTTSTFGRADEVRPILEPWANKEGKFITTLQSGELALAISIPAGEEKDKVVRDVDNQLKEMAEILSILKPNSD